MEERHVKTGKQWDYPFYVRGFKGTVWIGMHILKLILAVMETVLFLTGSVAKIVLLVLA